MPSGRSATMLEAAIALVLFGCIPVAIRAVSANPWTIGVFRLVIATAGLYAILRRRGPLPRVSRRDVAALGLIGTLFFAHWLTYFVSIKISSASIGSIGLSTYGVDLLALGVIFGRQRFHAIDAAAVGLAVCGAILVIPAIDIRNNITMGMLLACLSAFFYATLPLLHQRFSSIPSSIRALGQFGFALVLFLMFLPKTRWSLPPADWAALAFLALGSTLIGHSLWVRVTTQLPPATTSLLYYGNLPVAIALSAAVLGEPLTPRLIAGAALIMGGGVLGLGSQWWRNTRRAPQIQNR